VKILQINSHYNQGGAARIVACIHRQLLQEGEDSWVAYGRGEKHPEQICVRFDAEPEIYWSALVSLTAGINGWSNRIATARLVRLIRKIQPDVIHLHALHGYYLHWPTLFGYINQKQIPCVWTFHDCHAFTGNCGYFFDCEKWKNGCKNCPNIHVYPKSLWFDWSKWMWKRKKALFTATDNKVIVSPSQWMTEQAKQSYFHKYECITIPNGIDTQGIFYPRNRAECRQKYGFTQEEKLVLGIAVGYRDERKGARYILKLAEHLSAEAKIILIGWNEEDNPMLEGLTNVITMPNTSDASMLAEYYSLADVFVIPSLAENYATTVLESMACGTPAVGFDAGGTPELLKEKRGIAVKAGDQQAFDAAVRAALAQDNDLLRGEELAALIREENDMAVMTGKYLDLYRRMAADRIEDNKSMHQQQEGNR